VDEKIEENDKIFILVSFLPPLREQLVMNTLVRNTTLNFNKTVVYLLEAESLKNLHESLFSVDQALTVSCGARKVKNHGKNERTRDNVHAIYVTKFVT